MLEQLTHIEGLSQYEDHELYDDTSPGSVQTKFSVVSEEIPFLTAKEGKKVFKNFVHVERVWELGRSKYSRRVRDDVVWNEDKNSWEIRRLANKEQSDIRKNPNEWNAFMKGVQANEVGTPLTLLFPYDPSRIEFYHGHHIKTVERLAGLNPNDRKDLGMGVSQDCERAERYLEKVKLAAPGVAINAKLDEKDKQIAALTAQIEDLSSKLTQMLQAQLSMTEEVPVKKIKKITKEEI